jgi:hypothetical protein
VLKAEQLPASIANLNTTLAQVKAEDLTHFEAGFGESSSCNVQARCLNVKSGESLVCRVM